MSAKFHARGKLVEVQRRTARPVEQTIAGLYCVVHGLSASVVIDFPEPERELALSILRMLMAWPTQSLRRASGDRYSI